MDRGTYKDIVNGLGERGPEVARRLVAAVRAIDGGDAELAGRHADIARRLGTRLAPVREAVGLIAYEIGQYEVALRDLRAAQRMSGALDLLPIIADCERAVGRPQRALDIAASVEVQQLEVAGRVEMIIVAAGARGDLGQLEAAVETLRGPLLTAGSTAAWQERLWYAFADALVSVGRPGEADAWFARAAAHPEAATDAEERLAQLRTDVGDAGADEIGEVLDLENDQVLDEAGTGDADTGGLDTGGMDTSTRDPA